MQHTGAVSVDDFAQLHEQFRAQLFDREVHMYAPYSIVFGQKPADGVEGGEGEGEAGWGGQER